MIDPTEFSSDLHLTLVLIAAVFTLMCVHMLRYVLAGRNRATELEEMIDDIRLDGETREMSFRNNLRRTSDIIDNIEKFFFWNNPLS